MVKNSTILERVWLESSNDFQQRIPNPSINGYANAINELFEPYNHDLFNQFANMLVGMMGTYVESKLFENPLRELKKPARTFGNTERGVAVKYLQAHSPKVDDETLLKLEKPEFREWFYSVSPGRRYEFSWSIYEMRRVFSDPDGYGYDELLSATITQMRSSDNYDEMNSMIQMFAEGDRRMGGLFRRNISGVPTDKATGQELLAKVKADARRMTFPTMLYNHIDIPVFETLGDNTSMIFWCTPNVDAAISVYALADLFNMSEANVTYRKIVIPEFPIPNVCAALTSEDFIYCRDVWYGIEPPFYNPANRTYKYYLFHDQMLGVNPVANCILYTTDAEDVIPTVKMTVTGLAFSPNTATVPLGGSVKLNLELQGSVDGSDSKIAVEPDAGMFSIAAMRGSGDNAQAVALNSRTYVDDYGVLHTQKSDLAVGDVITVTAKSAYINPSAATTDYTATATVTVTAAETVSAKECPVEEKPHIEYTNETESVTASE